jgi:tetratricopeptide (TPR) repeat protein
MVDSKPQAWWNTIRRARLFRVLAVYLGSSYVVLEVVGLFVERLALPDWAFLGTVALLLIGLPVVVATAFVQQGLGRAFRPAPSPTAHEEGGERITAQEPPVGSGRVRRLLTWRNAIAGGVLAFALWGVIAAGSLLLSGSRATSPGVAAMETSSGADAIAVLPFAYQGDEDYAYLGEGIVDLLSMKLDGAGGLRSADPRAVLSFVSRDQAGGLDPAGGRRVAENLAAGRFVLGSIVEAGARLTIRATLYDSRDSSRPAGEANAEGQADDVFEIVDDLAAQLLAEFGSGPAARARRVAAVTTSSLPALRAYLDGERAYRLGQYQSAVGSLQRAVSIDTAYALAYYRLSVVAEMSTLAELAQEAAEKAVRHAGRLSDRDRRMLEAFRAWRRGAHREAERLYRSLVGSYPDEVEAWFELGEVLFHSNPFHGHSFTEAWEPLGRVLYFDPDNTPAMYHMARIASVEERWAEMDSLIRRHNQLNPGGDRELEVLALQAFAKKDADAADSVVARLRVASDVTLALAVWDVATWTDNVEGALRLLGLMVDPSRSLEVRTTGHAWRAHAHVARGQWTAAKRELEQLDALNPDAALEYRALISAYPFLSVDRAELAELREHLTELDPTAVPASGNPSVFFNAHDDLHAVIRGYLLGALSARLQDDDRAEAHAAALEELGGPPYSGTTTYDLASSIRAQALRARGRTAEALAALDRIEREVWYNVALASPFYAQTLERFLRAELLFELGRDDEAARWYANIAQVGPYEVAYRPVAYMRLGEIHERQGEPAEAADYYRRFLDLWADADPELQPQVEAARRAIEALSTDR